MSMSKKHFPIMAMLFFSLLFTGCTVAMHGENGPYKAMDLSGQDSADQAREVDNFLIILDTSSSMFLRPYSATKILTSMELVPFVGPTKFEQAKEILLQLNRTIPDLELTGGVRILGKSNELIYGLGSWYRHNLEQAVLALSSTGGTTPLAQSIHSAARDLAETTGNIAVIIISDGLPTNSPVLARAEELKKRYGNRLCIHTIQVGEDPKGKKLMDKIAAGSQCGLSVNGNSLIDAPERMADFVAQVFLGNNLLAMDSDGDGVVNAKDQCPDTLQGLQVDARGCDLPINGKATIHLKVRFDFDQAVIKKAYYRHLAQIAAFLKKHPGTRLNLQGHTCSMGSDEYNLKLSKKRARNVKRHLVEKHGIAGARISTKGYGENRPVASNQTLAGRQQNRRTVTATITVD